MNISIKLQEALGKIDLQTQEFGTEQIALEHAYGRTLAKEVYADRDYPPFNRSAMDGVALYLDKVNLDKPITLVGSVFRTFI